MSPRDQLDDPVVYLETLPFNFIRRPPNSACPSTGAYTPGPRSIPANSGRTPDVEIGGDRCRIAHGFPPERDKRWAADQAPAQAPVQRSLGQDGAGRQLLCRVLGSGFRRNLMSAPYKARLLTLRAFCLVRRINVTNSEHPAFD